MSCLAAFLLWAEPAPASPVDLAYQYQIGELAEADIKAPSAMAVVDPGRTAQLREQAAQRIPAVFRFHTEAAAAADLDLKTSFKETRLRFLAALKEAAKKDRLDEATMDHPSFRRFVLWFQKQNPSFPMSIDLARPWALGESGEAILADWSDRLRHSMEQCIHGDWLPPESLGDQPHVRMVQVDDPSEVLTLKSVETRGVDIKLNHLISISQGRQYLRTGGASQQDPTLGNYLAGFVRVNCFLEDDLTRRLREQGTTDMVAVDRYEEGQLIARRGQRIDSRIYAALEVIGRSRSAAMSPGSARRVVSTAANESGRQAGSSWWRGTFANPLRFEIMTRRSLVLAATVAVGLAFLLALLVRRKGLAQQRQLALGLERPSAYTVVMGENRNETVFLPLDAAAEGVPLSCATASPTGALESSRESFWRQRALEAEHRAEDILNMVRAGLAPQLARQMMNKLVQELITQRAEWLETSQTAEHELAEMERRFAHSHAQLQKRLRDFEKRTEELEQLLAVKTEENSELLKSQIALTQKQLLEAQSQNDTGGSPKVVLWN